MSTSETLARFVLDATPDDAVRDATARVVASVVERVVAGAGWPEVAAAAATIDPVTPGVVAPLAGGPATTVPFAALLTSTAAATQPSSPEGRAFAAVVGGGVAVTEARGDDGTALLDALAVGCELAARLVDELRRCGYEERGWDTAGAAGAIGTAAAVARLLTSPVSVVQQALGVAATQAAGLGIAQGTPTWALQAGKAAANGVEAAWACDAGLSGPPDGIGGRRGLLAVAAPGADATVLSQDLGRQWRLLDAVDGLGDVDGAWLERATRLGRPGRSVDELAVAARNGLETVD